MADSRPPLSDFHVDGPGDSRPPLESFDTSQEKSDLSLLDVPGQAFAHLGSSAKNFASSMAQPFIHPIETAKNIGKLGLGVSQKIGLGPSASLVGDYTPQADAVGQFFKERYGGWENLKKTMATDPVGFAADIATIATGGETALARLPGVVGKVGEVSGQVAKYTNPLNTTKAASLAGKVVTEAGGVLTGKGAESIKGAAQAGFEGGRKEKAFTRNLRDPAQFQDDILRRAKSAFSEMYKERSAEYQRNMLKTHTSQALLDFNDIDVAINKAHAIKQFQGRDISDIAGSRKALPADTVKRDIENAVASWKKESAKNPGYRTAGGFDALKQYIGDIKDAQPYGSPERKVADDIYSAIRNTIVKQEPSYARAMKSYQEASDKLDEIGKTLSLKKKASDDTALRKLLSSTRSDVSTNFGKRLSLVEELNRRDPGLLAGLHGQSLAPYAPGGLMRLGAGATGLGALAESGKAALLNPKVIAALLSTSPRLWGEGALLAGKGARKIKDLTPQEIIDLAKKANPDIIRRLGLGSRIVGGAGAQNP